jgi:hypothetical protein
MIVQRSISLAFFVLLILASLLFARAVPAAGTLPDTITGEWCIFKEAHDLYEPQIFVRSTPEDCHGGDAWITITQEGIEGEGSCAFDKIARIGPNAFLIYQRCDDDDTGGLRRTNTTKKRVS